MRSADFERRSVIYAAFDGQLCNQTRFFAAAALVNAVLAKRFRQVFAVHCSPRCVAFMREIGTRLEADNLRYARELRRRALRCDIVDRILVGAEQARVQQYVDARQARCPRQWACVRSELNDLLNNRYGLPIFLWSKDYVRISRALREVRGQLGMAIDFATESHRVRIGLKLIDHIRREAAAPGAKRTRVRPDISSSCAY